MSRSRQRRQPETAIAVRSLALRLPPAFLLSSHDHPWAQLVFATAGVMSVGTRMGAWVVPPQRAVWVPPDSAHTIETHGTVSLRTLYFRPGLTPSLPGSLTVLHVSPFLREIVLHIFGLGFLYDTDPAHVRLAGVLVDQLDSTAELPLDLRMPIDARARRVADRILAAPEAAESLETLARHSGASSRTLERLFRSETGMTFQRWRQRARLLVALRRLAQGASVSDVALDVGFASTSAFIAMFKRRLGTTPSRYFGDHTVESSS